MKRLAAFLAVALLVSCDESIDQQNRYGTYQAAGDNKAWPSEGEAIPLPDGTVAQGDAALAAALADPPVLTAALIGRGRERYNIFCAACHGLAGDGDGIIVARGFPKPLPFSDAAVIASDPHALVRLIGEGTGRMYGFSDRVAPADRWLIVAYIRALQLAALPQKAAP
ncbi:MAG TPA: cytochrome c [Dongiaceae bacterium]